MHYGPRPVVDSLVFCFDAGNVKCTDADDAVGTMRDIATVAHSSRADRGITGSGVTGSFSFPTDTGAVKAINTGVTGKNSDTDSTNYGNRLALDDDILFADQAAWSCEFWAKPNASAEHTYLSLAGRGATSPWLIWQQAGTTFYPRFRDNDGTYLRDSSNTNCSDPDDWHQVVFTADTSRNISFYKDGEIIGGSVQSTDTQLQINRIMAGYSSGTYRYGFQGSMLCARIYSKTLSAAEVLQNFNATRGRVGI